MAVISLSLQLEFALLLLELAYDNATSDVLSVIPLWQEMDYYKEYQEKLRGYLGKEKANGILLEALYLISMGTNDFLENYYIFPSRSKQYSVEEYRDFLLGIAKDFITELYQLGGRKIAISGLPPMGCLPLERTTKIFSGTDCVEKYNSVALDFNGKLQEMIKRLNKELPGIRLVLANPYDILLDIIQNPLKYGFVDAAKACCGTGMFEMSYLCNKRSPFTCPDASKYVFWDSFHPTEKTNWIIADHLVKTSLAEFL
ncbi:hypothetical protein Patl1_04117 [Pistacia atlantica]|uniref:Uncharacterized protein n=1 Tax=Pistacia atlantica TaxID=434234 RepID=A0ACC1BSB0_9ROSI|nr:hypothetical protein Patl1_04117 [Pistacia atlantica]